MARLSIAQIGFCLASVLTLASVRAESGPEYLIRLGLQTRATQADLLLALGRFAGVGGRESLQRTTELLKKEHLLDPSFQPLPARHVRRGDAALLFARGLRLEGGVSGWLFGRGRRSAYRELGDKGIMPPGGENCEMSGAELLGVLERVRAYRASGNRL